MNQHRVSVRTDRIADRTRWLRARVVAMYALFASLWILASDSILATLVDDRQVAVTLGTYKGWLFVGVTALLLFALLRDTASRRACRAHCPRFRLRKIPKASSAALASCQANGVFRPQNRCDSAAFPLPEAFAAPLLTGNRHDFEMSAQLVPCVPWHGVQNR